MLEVQLTVSSDELLEFYPDCYGFSFGHFAVLLEGLLLDNVDSEVFDVVGPIDFFAINFSVIFRTGWLRLFPLVILT